MSATGVCRSCGAKIIWRNHERTGRAAPLDSSPSVRGNIWTTEEQYGICSNVAGGGACHEHLVHYTNHFQTCPNARSHHKR